MMTFENDNDDSKGIVPFIPVSGPLSSLSSLVQPVKDPRTTTTTHGTRSPPILPPSLPATHPPPDSPQASPASLCDANELRNISPNSQYSRPAAMSNVEQPKVPDTSDAKSARSGKTGRSAKSGDAPSTSESVPAHKAAFQEFHAQLGVRLLKGSIGPVQDVPMMLKTGYRHVYVSRTFALSHGFIPKDTTPGSYGFNGITNLGKWPIQVGSKAVSLTVMLAEDTYFPVTLGRSFMEKRGVRTDPIDMTSVTFMDNGERADVEVVVVRDEKGEPVNIS
ncbi:unnamed protein product [Tilletia controversa]|nr:hypothetical protein CF336_g5171 [Tilletia laevis]KAE8198872.1 hypothetical protein CF335_g4294 [Tilletia laevis]CAD6896745.1 unnamed protein product [Tilletia caries]CAD6905781.1 unnamed protein product [Tilletia controversa]CAD6975370.1 unnamed protein product [Tilletia controversa]